MMGLVKVIRFPKNRNYFYATLTLYVNRMKIEASYASNGIIPGYTGSP